MKVFGFPLSPFVRKVHVVAAEKGIAVEMVLSRPGVPDPAFIAASPFKKIPALQDGDFTLSDSTAIATYFDGVQPEPPIAPGNPQQRARAIWFEEFADTLLIAAGGKVLFNRFVGPTFMGVAGDEALAQQGITELAPLLDYLEGEAAKGEWLAGGEFSIGDVAVACTLRSLGYVALEPDAASHPHTAAWYDRVKARPSWQKVAAQEQAVMDRVMAPAA